ncbi:MAG: hypothetical protein BWY09_02686 [Candidatus Hydrogenedentes bacterium ADurb.Bin179]|nr:MAG: hypothetical protein BWY09_02686 [Candidatus Hydrogenedentes bacterium ADurb.Bin179]
MFCKPAGLRHDGCRTARLNPAALVLGDGAKGTSRRATPVGGNAELYHVRCRNGFRITRMGPARKGQRVQRIQFIGFHWRGGWCEENLLRSRVLHGPAHPLMHLLFQGECGGHQRFGIRQDGFMAGQAQHLMNLGKTRMACQV